MSPGRAAFKPSWMRPNGKLPLPLPTPPGDTKYSAPRAGAASASHAAARMATSEIVEDRPTALVYRLGLGDQHPVQKPLRVVERHLRAQTRGQHVECVLGPRQFDQCAGDARAPQTCVQTARERD